jgi:hypothetical protein
VISGDDCFEALYARYFREILASRLQSSSVTTLRSTGPSSKAWPAR